MPWIIITLLALVLIFALSWLVRGASLAARTTGRGSATDDAARAVLVEDRERALMVLKDIEFDYSLKKLDDFDYQSLKTEWEAKALAAIKALNHHDEEHYGGEGPTSVALLALAGGTLALLLLAGASPAVAQPGGNPHGGGFGQVGAGTQLDVVRLTEAGAMVPFGGGSVAVRARKRLPGKDDRWEEVGSAVVVTNKAGKARVPRITKDANTELVATVFYKGHAFEGRASSPGERIVIVVYETTASLEDVSVRAAVSFSVDESVIRTQLDYVFVNRSPVAIDTSERDSALMLPIPSPVVGDLVVAQGWLPPQSSGHAATEVTPERGRVVFEGGGIGYRGLILPGEATRVRVAYPMNPPDDLVDLGVLAGELTVDELVVALRWGPRLDLSLRSEQPAFGSRTNDGSERIALLRMADPLSPGDAFRFRLGRLPVEGRVRRPVALWGGLGAVFALALIVLRGRGRRVWLHG